MPKFIKQRLRNAKKRFAVAKIGGTAGVAWLDVKRVRGRARIASSVLNLHRSFISIALCPSSVGGLLPKLSAFGVLILAWMV